MLNFNGRLVIKTCETTAVGQWSVAAVFSDNSGTFTARDVGVGDRVYAHGTNSVGTSALCAYRVTNVTSAATTATQLVCTLCFDEAYEDSTGVYTPDVDVDAMICSMSSDSGFAMIPSDVSGLPQSMLDQARNISLAQRDVLYAERVAAQIAAGGGGGGLNGGQVSGDVAVTGSVTASGGLSVTTSTGRPLTTIDADEFVVNLSGAIPALRVNVDAQEEVAPSTTIVSAGDVDATTTVNALATAKQSTTISGVTAASTSTAVSSRGATSVTNTVTGATAVSSLSVSGTTSAAVRIAAEVVDENGEAKVTIDAPSVRAEGQLSAKDLVADGMVAAAKFVQTSDAAATPDDNQLTTAKYVQDYVAANAFNDELGEQLATQMGGKADLDQVYTKDELDTRFTELGLGDLVSDEGHRVVTDEQIADWTSKQAGLGYTPEDAANKGAANGYAGLDESGHVVAEQMNDDHVNELITTRLANATTDDLAPTAGRAYATEEQVLAWTNKQDALGYTPEDAANKGAANGYAGLDESGHVVAAQMNDDHVNGLIDTALSQLTTDQIITTPENRFVSTEQVTAWTDKQDALGYTPEDANNRGVPGGYAALNNAGQLEAEQVNTERVNDLIDNAFAAKTTDDLPSTAEHRYVSDEQIEDWNSRQAGLGYTPENIANRNVPNGYAGLDGNGYILPEQLNFEDYNAVQVVPLGNEGLDLSSGGTRLVIRGLRDGGRWDFASFAVVDDGDLLELTELDPNSVLRIPFNLLSSLPSVLQNVAGNNEVRAEDLAQVVTPGEYGAVRINAAGLVEEGLVLEGTESTKFTVGVDSFNDTDYVTLYADAGLVNNPFIRYSLNDRRWEYSNNGHTVYSLGESEAIFEDAADCGFITEDVVEDDVFVWSGEWDLGFVAEELETDVAIDFNGDAFFSIEQLNRMD